MTVKEWIIKGHTGLSSKTIWSHFTLGLSPRWSSQPYDPSDFLRCYWLLQLSPDWRKRIGEIGICYPHWKPLTDNWDELEEMLVKAWPESCRTGEYCNEPPATEMYERMNALLRRETVKRSSYQNESNPQ